MSFLDHNRGLRNRVGRCLMVAAWALGGLVPAYSQVPIDPEVKERNKICRLFGGPNRERVQGLTVLQNGDVLVVGETKSNFAGMSEFPTSPPPFDSTLNPTGESDAYLAVLNGDLTTIKYWTYIGGSEQDRAYVAVEEPTAPFNIWVCGFTASYPGSSQAFPVQPPSNYFKNGACATSGCSTSCWDVFVAKFNPTLQNLLASTIVGGSGNENPRGTLTLAMEGTQLRIYVSGGTSSLDFFVTSGMPGAQGATGSCVAICQLPPPPPPPLNSVVQDVFIVKLNSTGGVIWSRCLGGDSTVVGGDADDVAWANVRVESATGDLFIGGCTRSPSFSLSSSVDAGALVYGTRQGAADGFVAKLSSTGSVRAIRYLGGTGTDWVAFNDCLELDAQQRPVVLGLTRSGDLPCTAFALSSQHSNGSSPPDCDPDSNDVFVAKLSNDLSSVIYTSYVNKVPGGSPNAIHREEPAGLAISGGNIFISGETDSLGYPTTGNAFDNIISQAVMPPDSQAHDAFLTKLFPGVSGSSVLHYSTFFGGDISSFSADEPGNRGRSLSVIPSGANAGLAILGGQTTTEDFGLPAANHLTTTGVVFPVWFSGDVRSGFIAIHNTN